MKNHFRVELGKVAGRVWLNGEELSNVRSVQVNARVNEPTTVTVEFYAYSVNEQVDKAADTDGRN